MRPLPLLALSLLIAAFSTSCGRSNNQTKLGSEFKFAYAEINGSLPEDRLLVRLLYHSKMFHSDGKPRLEHESRSILLSWSPDGPGELMPLALVDDVVSPVISSHRTAPAIWTFNLFHGEAVVSKPYEHVRRDDFTPSKYRYTSIDQSPDGSLAVAASDFGQLYLLSGKAEWRALHGQTTNVHSFQWNHDNTLIALTDSGDVVTIAFDPDSLSVLRVETHQQGTNDKRAIGRIGEIIATSIDTDEKFHYRLLLDGNDSGIVMDGSGTPLSSEHALVISEAEAVHVIFADGTVQTTPTEESINFSVWTTPGKSAVGIGIDRVWKLAISEDGDVSLTELGTVIDLLRPESFIESDE